MFGWNLSAFWPSHRQKCKCHGVADTGAGVLTYRTWMHCGLFASRIIHTHAPWYSHEHTKKIDMEEKKLLNKVIMFVFFAHKKYSCIFITLLLKRWYHMTILLMSLLPFWALNMSVMLLSMQVQRVLSFHQKHRIFCYEDEKRSYGFGTTWGWVINDLIFSSG